MVSTGLHQKTKLGRPDYKFVFTMYAKEFHSDAKYILTTINQTGIIDITRDRFY